MHYSIFFLFITQWLNTKKSLFNFVKFWFFLFFTTRFSRFFWPHLTWFLIQNYKKSRTKCEWKIFVYLSVSSIRKLNLFTVSHHKMRLNFDIKRFWFHTFLSGRANFCLLFIERGGRLDIYFLFRFKKIRRVLLHFFLSKLKNRNCDWKNPLK